MLKNKVIILLIIFILSLFFISFGINYKNNISKSNNTAEAEKVSLNQSYNNESNTKENNALEKVNSDEKLENNNKIDGAQVSISSNDANKNNNKENNSEGNKEYNKKYSWSMIRKKNHLPPGFEAKQVELAEKYKAIYLGDTCKKIIYLTFDEGYENGYTPKILDILKKHNVKAAFFITMPYLQKQFDLVDRMVKEGHIVGNHTVNHLSLPGILDDNKLENEILKLDMMFKEKTGQDMKYLRPPMGEYSERTLKVSRDLGYTNVFWSFAYADWDTNNQKGADFAYKMVMDNVHNGAVMLLHAVSKDNADALDRIITDLKAQGYSFGSLDDIQ